MFGVADVFQSYLDALHTKNIYESVLHFAVSDTQYSVVVYYFIICIHNNVFPCMITKLSTRGSRNL
jgi:hypothetical protein